MRQGAARVSGDVPNRHSVYTQVLDARGAGSGGPTVSQEGVLLKIGPLQSNPFQTWRVSPEPTEPLIASEADPLNPYSRQSAVLPDYPTKLKLGSEDLASPATTPTHSPAKRTFAKISPTAGPSKSKGKEKATDGEESEDETEDDGEVDIEPEEEEEDNSAPKPARGRRRKAILKDAAKRLKKL
ncbi:hypothetical protein PtB15_1B969 [Puccinia triticina]|nr:hypothetical protein PtB15_1B969 [Puccinia triticina]